MLESGNYEDRVSNDCDRVTSSAGKAESTPPPQIDPVSSRSLAARIIGRRCCLSPDRARLIAELAGLGGKDEE